MLAATARKGSKASPIRSTRRRISGSCSTQVPWQGGRRAPVHCLTRSLRFESVECIVPWNSIARRNELLAPRRPSGKSPDLAPGSGFSVGADANGQICDALSLLAIRSVRHRGLSRSLEVLNGRATTSPRLVLNSEAQGRGAAETRTGVQASCELALERNDGLRPVPMRASSLARTNRGNIRRRIDRSPTGRSYGSRSPRTVQADPLRQRGLALVPRFVGSKTRSDVRSLGAIRRNGKVAVAIE